jgi:hypothetical protein
MEKPKLQGQFANKELEKADAQFQAFEKDVHNMTLDHLNKTPKLDTEPQYKLSNREIRNAEEIYLKPVRSINTKEPFNEIYREQWKKDWEYVLFIAENNEVKGETIETWTKRYAGDPAHFWKIPVGKPVRGPRMLADKLSRCCYHRLKSEDMVTDRTGMGTMYGAMVVDHTVNRLDARPVGSAFVSMAS